MHRIYLDNNATTPVLPEVFEAMRSHFCEEFGNASSIHHHGQRTRAAVERARESVAALLGCRASEIVFTSGGTEADNLAIAGLVGAGDHVITSSIEHHAVLLACKHLEEIGAEVTVLPVDARSMVDPADVRRALRPNTKLISIMMANNETGVLQPVEGDFVLEVTVAGSFRPWDPAGRGDRKDRGRGGRLFSHGRSAGGWQGCYRCEYNRLPRTLHFRAQDSRAAGSRSALRAEGNSNPSSVVWWQA